MLTLKLTSVSICNSKKHLVKVSMAKETTVQNPLSPSSDINELALGVDYERKSVDHIITASASTVTRAVNSL